LVGSSALKAVVVVVALLLAASADVWSVKWVAEAAETAAAAAGASKAAVDHAQEQIDWIRRKGGFFHSKLEFRKPEGAEESSVITGVYATEDLPKGETLFIIPNECLLKSLGHTEEDCDTVRNLVKQRKLGDKSEYAPYVKYLFEGAHPPGSAQVPSAYSVDGKRILNAVLGELPPDHMTSKNWYWHCEPDEDEWTELHEQAYFIHMRRNWQDVLIPIYDMVNHRLGKFFFRRHRSRD